MALGVPYRHAFRVRVGIAVLDDATGALTNQFVIQDEHCAVALITPGLGAVLHRQSLLIPLGLRVTGLRREPIPAERSHHQSHEPQSVSSGRRLAS